MATIKSFTSLQQSKKLAKILPLESADMTFRAEIEDIKDETIINGWKIDTGTQNWEIIAGLDIAIRNNLFSYRNGYVFPCWSLAALLSVLDYPQLSKDKLGSGKVGWMISVYPNDCRYDSCWHDNPVDACVDMIEKLNELKML